MAKSYKSVKLIVHDTIIHYDTIIIHDTIKIHETIPSVPIINNIPSDSKFTDVTIGDLIAGIFIPLLILLITERISTRRDRRLRAEIKEKELNEERNKRDHNILRRISFMDALERTARAALVDYEAAITNLAYTKNIETTDTGGLYLGIDTEHIKIYDKQELIRQFVTNVVLLKSEHQNKKENNKLNLTNGKSSGIDFDNIEQITLLEDLNKVLQAVDTIDNIHKFRSEFHRELDKETKPIHIQLFLLIMKLDIVVKNIHDEFANGNKANIPNVFFNAYKLANIASQKKEPPIRVYLQILKPILDSILQLQPMQSLVQIPNVNEYIDLISKVDILLQQYMVRKQFTEPQFGRDINTYAHHIQVINDFLHKQRRFYFQPDNEEIREYPILNNS